MRFGITEESTETEHDVTVTLFATRDDDSDESGCTVAAAGADVGTGWRVGGVFAALALAAGMVRRARVPRRVPR